ncbi:unnamed protein product [Durusdinium trenchii]|uniref:TIR domain-containing protein n=1 Tax=Durusdinium trenchii TaxID=1381693 RepID=A0ABP0NE92_9DINO
MHVIGYHAAGASSSHVALVQGKDDALEEDQLVLHTESLEHSRTESMQSEDPVSDEEAVVPVDVPYAKCRWDFFLSHKQSNAQDAVQNLRLALSERFLGASFWLDIEQDPTVKGMCHGVSNSRNVLIFLTEGISDSKFCQMEMRWALEANRNLILVMETDDRHGKPNMEELIHRCPDDLKAIFTQNEIIPWFRDPEFRFVSVDKILKSCADDPRRNASNRKAAKPLVYGKGGDSEEGAEVFDRSFVIFTAMCGVALPGAGPKTKCWAVAVRIILLTCGMMCCSRLLTPEGPAFLDYLTIIQIVAAHPMIFLLLHVMLVLLRSDLIADLLENHIDCPSEGKKLRFKTKLLTGLVALLTTTLSLWGWVGYLPGFFHPYYLTSGNGLVVYGIAHGLTWILILPIFFGSFFAALMIMFTLQELCNMALLTAYNELNSELEHEGLEAVVKRGDGINVTDHDLYRFEVKYAKSWELYKKIQSHTAMPLFVFWFIELGLVIWSVWSMAQGAQSDVNDWRVPHLKSYWNLVVRLSWFVGGSPWFGAGCWITALLPWGSIYYAWRMNNLSKRLIFKNPTTRHAFRSFLAEFALEFRVSFLQATPKGLLLFVPILVVNTLGFVFDALRLFNSI